MIYFNYGKTPAYKLAEKSALIKQRDASERLGCTRRKIYDVLTSQLQPPYIAAGDGILS